MDSCILCTDITVWETPEQRLIIIWWQLFLHCDDHDKDEDDLMTTIMTINYNDDDENRAMKGELVQMLRDFLSRVTPELPPVLPIGRQDLNVCS